MRNRQFIIYTLLFFAGVCLSSIIFFIIFPLLHSADSKIEDADTYESDDKNIITSQTSSTLKDNPRLTLCEISRDMTLSDFQASDIKGDFFKLRISVDEWNDVFYLVDDLQQCNSMVFEWYIDEEKNIECKLKYAMRELFSWNELDSWLTTYLLSKVAPFEKWLEYIQSGQCSKLGDFDKKLPEFCSNKDSFFRFQEKIFQESLSTICKS